MPVSIRLHGQQGVRGRPGSPVSKTAAVPSPTQAWAVYLLHCAGGKCYIGISPAPQERFAVHRSGKGAAFTRANMPQTLAAIVWFEHRSAAASMEARLKMLSRSAKLGWFARLAAKGQAAPMTLPEGLASLEP